MTHGPRQLTLFPVFATAIKNCPECSKDFTDYSQWGRAHVCPACRKPKHPKLRELKSLAGKPLSRRELQIAELLADGKINKEIAWLCKLTEGTIKVYTSRMFAKAEVNGRIKFIMWWLKKNNRLVA